MSPDSTTLQRYYARLLSERRSRTVLPTHHEARRDWLEFETARLRGIVRGRS